MLTELQQKRVWEGQLHARWNRLANGYERLWDKGYGLQFAS
jgi:hypothetical protein